MQPTRYDLRKVALSVLFICSLVAIMFMGSRANADGETSEDALIASTDSTQLHSEIVREAEAIESRDNKIAIYLNYVQLTGVSAEYDGETVTVPVMLFAEAMCDCTVRYTDDTLRISAKGVELEAVVGCEYVVANGRYLYVPGGVKFHDDGPISASIDTLSKIFGCEYNFDSESKSLYITRTGEFIEQGDGYYNKKDLYWLSRIINAESRGESFYGKLAVGTVVMNRVASTRFQNTVYGVVFAPGQFTPAESGAVNMAPSEDSVIAAKVVLDGYRVNENILFFHAVNGSDPYYVNFEDTDTEMAIGNHYFHTYYRR